MKHFWLAFLSLAFAGFFLAAPTAQAHPGHYHPEEEVDEFADEAAFRIGALHPFTGLDHLLAAVTVGALAFTLGRQQGAAHVGAFLGSLSIGYALGHGGLLVPMLEPGLALAVLAAGLLLVFSKHIGYLPRVLIIAAIGYWNGNAHGMEAANSVYGIGLLTGTAVITGLGMAAAAMGQMLSPLVPRYAGAAVAVTGLALVATRMI